MIAQPAACRRHRPVLEALIERGERDPRTAGALDHLATCRSCEHELTELALTLAALRRVGREARRAPVPAPAPARVVALAAAPRRQPGRWAWRMQLGGLLAGAAIAALVVMPRSLYPTQSLGDAPARPVVADPWRAAETRIAAAPDTPSMAAPSAVPPRYPEGLLRPWKEVFGSDVTPRELKPR